VEAIMFETFSLFIPTTQSLRTIRLYANDICLTEACDVLIMHDAQNLFDDFMSYSGLSWGVKEALNHSSYTHLMIVGIDNHPKERMNEYSPFITQMTFKERNIHGLGGKGYLYLDFIVDTLIPDIKTRYHVTNTFYMAGSSMGAYISMFAAIRYPHIFSAIGSFSISSWFNEQEFLQALLASDIHVDTLFWVSLGTNESSSDSIKDFNDTYINNSKHVIDVLKHKKIKNIHFELYEGEHNEKQWRELFPKFISFLQKNK
jgi:predicted alpha/beta superfamily hydrolase